MVFDFGVSRRGLLRLLGLLSDAIGTTDAQSPTNKTINTTNNIITSTSRATGDILKDNGTKQERFARGAANLPLKVKSDGSDLEYAKLDVAGGGTGQVTLSTGTVLIGAGTSGITTKANPAGAFLGDSDVQNVTGTKSWFDTTLAYRNPANTFTLTMKNPAITADGNTMINQPYKYLVYRDTSTIYCKNQQDGRIESSGSTATPETIIQYALDNALRSSVYIAPSSSGYNFSAGFTGLTLSQQETTLVMDTGTLLTVPNGYTGSLLILSANLGSHIIGGRFTEAGTPSKLWTGVYLHAVDNTPNRVNSCSFRNMYIRFANNAFRLHTDTNGWINGCEFDKILADNGIVGFLFEHTGTYTDAQSGSNSNDFNNIVVQATTGTTYGFKDVNGRRNYFKNCYLADFTGAQITMNITANAKNTHIAGGTCTYLNFADLSTTGSWIRDEFSNDFVPIRKTSQYEDQVAMTAPSSPSTGTIRRYTKTIDSNNDGWFCKARVNGAVVEVQMA